MDTMTLKLKHPLTEEEWDAIIDVDLEHTHSVTFHTKNGKEVEFEKRKKGKWIDNETSYADGVRQTCTCSVCGIRSVRPLGDFCRWCGADMREDTDNKTTVCPMCFDCPDNCPFGADMRKENR